MLIENIEQRHAILAAIIEGSEDAIISKNLDSRITSWNKAAERMFEYTEQEAVGQLIYMLIPEDRRHEEEMILSQLRLGKSIEHFETVRLTKSGRELQVSLMISPMKSYKGVVLGASKIVRDITRQKQNEQRLELVNSVGRSIAASLDIAEILRIVVTASTKICEAQFGEFYYNKVDANGESTLFHTTTFGTQAGSAQMSVLPYQYRFVSKDILRADHISVDAAAPLPPPASASGRPPYASYLAVPMVSQGGTVIGLLFFGHAKPGMFNAEHENLVAAIAGQAAIALDNAKLYDEISALNKNKDQFIGFASHELKTPLTTIKGYMQLAETGEMTPALFFPRIHKQLGRLENIIADLLDISKIQAGKLDLHFTKSSLSDLLKESVESVDLSHHHVRIESSRDATINIDYQKMMQVLVNLLSNAAKYSDHHTNITLSGAVQGDDINFCVRDEGSGIPAEHLNKIFNQFYRVTPRDTHTKGMGLGLYISKQIVEGHLGKIWVESDGKKGSAFHIKVPVHPYKPTGLPADHDPQ